MKLSRKKIILIVAALIGIVAIVVLSSRLKNKEGEGVQTGAVQNARNLNQKSQHPAIFARSVIMI
jgi:hypothetical protein